MYRLEFLPIAEQDMVDIVKYISVDLDNPTAADNLAVKLIKSIERLQQFPYAYPVYAPLRPLKLEYRKLPVENYMVFYYVDEGEKLTTVARVVYARRESSRLLGQ